MFFTDRHHLNCVELDRVGYACIARMLLHDLKGSDYAAKSALAGLSVDRVGALKPTDKVAAGRRVTLRAEVVKRVSGGRSVLRGGVFCISVAMSDLRSPLV